MKISNLANRKDIRSEREFRDDLREGEKREGKIVDLWAARHNEKYGKIFEIIDHNRVNIKFNPGRHIDHFDFDLRISKNGKLHDRRIEVEHLAKSGKYFRFKRYKLERCCRKNCGIFYVHNLNSKNPKLRVFDYPWIVDRLENGEFIYQERGYNGEYRQIYGGKYYTKLCSLDYDDWVDFNTLEDEKVYFDHMRVLLKRVE